MHDEPIERARELITEERVVELTRVLCALQDEESEMAVAQHIAETLGNHSAIEVHFEEVVRNRPNVIATVQGGDRPPFVLNGHTDASIVPDGWRNEPRKPWIEGSTMFGAGINDMLGAVAAMVAATEAAPSLGDLPGDLILQAVMHHDTIGLGTKYALASEGPTEGYGICGEPSSLEIHTANGGAIKFAIELVGETAHVSRRDEGRDTLRAAVEIHRALDSMRFTHQPFDRLPDLPLLLVGQMESGFAPGAVPHRTVIRGDLRTVPGMARTTVKSELTQLVAQICGEEIEHSVRLTAVQQPYVGPTSGKLIDAVSRAHKEYRGAEPAISSRLPAEAFVTDAADLAAFGLETIVYGPGDWHHAPNQSMEIADLVDSARVYLSVAAMLV